MAFTVLKDMNMNFTSFYCAACDVFTLYNVQCNYELETWLPIMHAWG